MNLEQNLKDLINSESGDTCLLLGPGPSMLDFPYSNFKGKIICFGDSILRGKGIFQANYWIASNNEFPVPDYQKHLDIINSFKNINFIFSDTALYDNLWTKSDSFLNENLKVKWACYDERHFDNNPCNPKKKCCNLINTLNKRLCLQEMFKEKFNSKTFKLEIGNTVAEYALYLALILGFKKIFIQGVDLPRENKDYIYYENKEVDKLMRQTMQFISKNLRKKYISENGSFKFFIKRIINRLSLSKGNLSVYNKKNILSKITSKINPKKKSIFNEDISKILNKFDTIAEIVKPFNIKIINVNKNSTLSECKNINYLSPNNILL